MRPKGKDAQAIAKLLASQHPLLKHRLRKRDWISVYWLMVSGNRMWDWLWKETPEQSSFLPPVIGFYQMLMQTVAFAAFTKHPKETQQPA